MRTAARSLEIAELAVRWRDAGVVGFDIAGAEAGYPPTRHLDAFQHVQRENFHATIHAGEAFGLPCIWEAVQCCGAERLGHGVRIVDDIQVADGEHHLGRLAAYVRDRRIPLELCPTSNVNTGVVDSIADHPIGMLRQLRFRVTVNTDNRLMSNTSMGNELLQLSRGLRLGLGRLRVADRQRHEERVRAVRRALADHQRPGQARLRAAEGPSTAIGSSRDRRAPAEPAGVGRQAGRPSRIFSGRRGADAVGAGVDHGQRLLGGADAAAGLHAELGPYGRPHQRTASTVAPPAVAWKPVEVLTKSAPAATDASQAFDISSSLSSPDSMITLSTAG